MDITQVAPSEVPINLLLEADPSTENIKRYLDESVCFIALLAGETVGAYAIKAIAGDTYELMSIAVAPEYQRQGIGSALLRHAIDTVREKGASRFEVGTGTFGYQLTYYQRVGFRPYALEVDYFLQHYRDPIYENGIQHQDRLRLAIAY
ncbi:GNAT family N-acetyltransferase [Alkalilimnicola ehrlichii]|uniref:GNAT family N-acetyltransferase n=1 Tax=Alkalilimnicola ehrlichii TaxID=351052 RepID=A0A3E0X0Z3_9GAMM|nr:GNAT family N-acetyltransferase [Alkalilimnicola ehrlichii]RFA31406.1 GNAT family N-acetyltransferase [Alkalilimnicola ehrlichii]RFA39323.1 GNAT family N-acetyltransferase [Alkalilimnicola ehrlichii]